MVSRWFETADPAGDSSMLAENVVACEGDVHVANDPRAFLSPLSFCLRNDLYGERVLSGRSGCVPGKMSE